MKKEHTVAYLMHGARNVGGGEKSVYYLIRGLSARFVPVVLYTHENEIIRRLREDGVRLVRLDLDERITSVYRDRIRKDPVSLFIYAVFLFSAMSKVYKALKAAKPDILHPHDNLSKIIGAMPARLLGIKVVAHCRDLLKETAIERMLAKYQLLFMDRVIAVSESNKNVFGKSKKVSTIYNGIDIGGFGPAKGTDVRTRLGIKDGTAVIGIVGVFDACKGHAYLFKAMEMLTGSGVKDIVCLVIGDGRERGALEASVKECGISGSVRFLGYRNDVPELLKAIDILAMPSIQESFPRAALEAMAMSVPVVATNVGGLPEAVEDGVTGTIVPPADPVSLANAIRRLVEDPGLREEMGRAGRKRVEERFSLESNIKKTEELYLEVLGGAGA